MKKHGKLIGAVIFIAITIIGLSGCGNGHHSHSTVEVYAISPDIYEFDDNMLNAKVIDPWIPQQRNFDYHGDVDFVKVLIPAGTYYTVYTDIIDYSCDTYIEIYDSRGNLIDYNDDAFDGSGYSMIEGYSFYDEVLYIRVDEFYSNLGFYWLNVETYY